MEGAAGKKAPASGEYAGMAKMSAQAGDLTGNYAASRLEMRLLLELAIEARFPRLIPKKPLYGGLPIGEQPALMHTITLNACVPVSRRHKSSESRRGGESGSAVVAKRAGGGDFASLAHSPSAGAP